MYRLYRINFADVGNEMIESMYFRGIILNWTPLKRT